MKPLVAEQLELVKPLQAVWGNADYRQYVATFQQAERILSASGMETSFVQRLLSRILCIYFFEFWFIAFLEEADPVRKSA
jgi:hypothetical protein